MSKRSFMGRLWKIVAVGVGAVLFWGAWRFAGFDPTPARAREVDPGLLDTLKTGEPLHVESAGSWLLRTATGEVVALDDRCPHLGCRPKWNPDSGMFECPCHGSVFSAIGDLKRGPATKPMQRLTMERVGDRIRLAE
jgi:cytochrome b6-f complex iron-sulfur subunit